MISGGAVLVALFIVSLGVGVLIGAAWHLARSVVDLAKGNSDSSFSRALKVLVLFSFLTGLVVFWAVYEDGLARGLKTLVYGSKTFNALTFWLPFAVQTVALLVVMLAWRKRRQDPDEG